MSGGAEVFFLLWCFMKNGKHKGTKRMLTRDNIISITNFLATPHMHSKPLGDIAHILHTVWRFSEIAP